MYGHGQLTYVESGLVRSVCEELFPSWSKVGSDFLELMVQGA